MYKLENLKDLLDLQLKDIYSVEQQLLPTLEKMAGACNKEELRIAFIDHSRKTLLHVERIRDCAIEFQFEVEGYESEAIKGLIAEVDSLIRSKETSNPDVLDAALIINAQKIEHYEIPTYASIITYMEILGYNETAETLKSTLSEEKESDELLNTIAKRLNLKKYINY